MPNKIIDETGAYVATTFTGQNGTWSLISTESSGDSSYSRDPKPWKKTSVAKTLDEFKNIETGERMVTTRVKVYNKAEAGTIFLT